MPTVRPVDCAPTPVLLYTLQSTVLSVVCKARLRTTVEVADNMVKKVHIPEFW